MYLKREIRLAKLSEELCAGGLCYQGIEPGFSAGADKHTILPNFLKNRMKLKKNWFLKGSRTACEIDLSQGSMVSY